MTDAQRFDWIQREGASLHTLTDDVGKPTGFSAHQEEIGWASVKESPGAAVDAAAIELMKSRAEAKRRSAPTP